MDCIAPAWLLGYRCLHSSMDALGIIGTGMLMYT